MERHIKFAKRGQGKTYWLAEQIKNILDTTEENCYVLTAPNSSTHEVICDYLTSMGVKYSIINSRLYFINSKPPKNSTFKYIAPKKVPVGGYVFGDEFMSNLSEMSLLPEDIHFYGNMPGEWLVDIDWDDEEVIEEEATEGAYHGSY